MKKITQILLALALSFASVASLADVSIKADVVYGHKAGMYPILTPVIDFQCFFHLLPVLDLFKHFSRLSFARVPYVSFKLLCLEGLKGFKGDSNRLHGLIRGYMGYIRLKGLQGKPGVTRKYRRMQGVTRGYKGLQGVTGG